LQFDHPVTIMAWLDFKHCWPR